MFVEESSILWTSLNSSKKGKIKESFNYIFLLVQLGFHINTDFFFLSDFVPLLPPTLIIRTSELVGWTVMSISYFKFIISTILYPLW